MEEQMINTKKFAIGLFIALANLASAHSDERILRILREFPSEKQMIVQDYVLGRGTCFDSDEHAIYFCSQQQHTIIKIDYSGNLIQRIGRHGQGPGEFNFPLTPYLIGDRLLVTDNGNARLQIFSLDGAYIGQIRMIMAMRSIVAINDHLYMHHIKQFEESLNSPVFYGKYDMKGKLIHYFGEIGKSDYDNFFYDNNETIRSFENQLHSLQRYGTTYRIYDPMGKLIREFELEINPLKDREYKKTGWLYTYRSFVVDTHRIYATHAAKGKIVINVFDRDGKYLYKYSSVVGSNDIYEVSDMKIVQQDNKKLLLLFLHYPEAKFILAELEE